MATASQLTFLFGVELEFLLGSRSKKHKTWASLAAELSTRLAKAGISNHVNAGNEKTSENYREWSIVREVTVPEDIGKSLWGLELVSPILVPSPAEIWVTELQTIFSVLERHFIITPSVKAGTHVHVSTTPPALGLSQQPGVMLAAVAKAVLYFEPALDALLPASRSSDPYWCQSNRASVAMRTLPGLADCFALLDRCCYTNQQHHDNNSYYGHYYGDESNNGSAIGGGGRGGVEQVVRAMCLFPATSAYGRSHGFKSDFVHGVYKWDFSGLLPDTGAGTLEFRQCPGSRTADEARAWVEVGLCFVAGAVDVGHSLDPGVIDGTGDGAGTNSMMDDLWWLLCAGARSTGIGELRGIGTMDFTGGGNGVGGGVRGAGGKSLKVKSGGGRK
ncbi:hypothetical protein UCREL1_10491 [Eutypa lata UCREL1]|uniref:Amidoligase enzyme protein n=1 Tax=Eutypa lata (strain UCR-EL1) TaxID=1287681 RepID=M7SEI1_EUTLA|nr:hypothetical protein UCREL1_10491 [Eutypa lata UCREL1]